jgi:hypothetical protein
VRSLGDIAGVVLPALKVKKGRIRVSYSAAHRGAVMTPRSRVGTQIRQRRSSAARAAPSWPAGRA